MKRIYLDYASLTPIDKGVLSQVKKYSSDKYSNASALYLSAVNAKKALEDAKNRVAKILHAHPDEIVFTSGGTESNKLVLNNFKNIVTSSIEHSSIYTHDGVKYVGVDKDGLLDLESLKNSMTADTDLVSVMLVNNEIGTVEPVNDVVKIVRDINKDNEKKILVHTDASQAATHFPLYVEKLGVDLITLDSAKIYGPRGVGMLYVKRGSVNIDRAGTENIPGIMGFVYALELADKIREKETKRIMELKEFFIKELFSINPEIKINGSTDYSSPHILNISIPNIDNEFFILQLDAKGIECSAKSACLRDEDESYVLSAIGADSRTSVRLSFGRKTTKGDIKKTLKFIREILEKNIAKKA